MLFHTLAISLRMNAFYDHVINVIWQKSKSQNFPEWNLRLCFSTMTGSIPPRRTVVDVIACALSYIYKDFNGASSWLWSRVPTGISSSRTALHKYKTILCTPCWCKYGYWYLGNLIISNYMLKTNVYLAPSQFTLERW